MQPIERWDTMRRHWRSAGKPSPWVQVSVHSYIGLGGVYYDLKRYEEAILTYQEAFRVPDSPGTSTNAHTLSYNGLGNAYNDLGRYQEAAAAFQQAIALDPGFVHARRPRWPASIAGLATRPLSGARWRWRGR